MLEVYHAIRKSCHDLRKRGERYVLGVPCTTTMRDLEAPLPAYHRAWTATESPVAIGDGVAPSTPWRRGRI